MRIWAAPRQNKGCSERKNYLKNEITRMSHAAFPLTAALPAGVLPCSPACKTLQRRDKVSHPLSCSTMLDRVIVPSPT